MKKSLLLVLIAIFYFGSLQLSAQTTQTLNRNYSEHPYWIEMMQDPTADFNETVEAFNQYWDGREITKGCGYKPFKRWEYHWRSRLNEDGTRRMNSEVFNEFNNFKASYANRDNDFEGDWTNLGPIEKPGNSGTGQPNGNGRVNALDFDPNNADIIYAGAPAGGFWISQDGGETWDSYTDNLPTLGVSSIAVDYVNTSLIYMGTGDRDAGDANGMGVFKSTDAGQTWVPWNTGMGNRTVGRLLMHPQNNNLIFAATDGGLYKTVDAGANWYQVKSGNIKEVVFKADDPNVVFASGSGNFYRSADGGESFTQITSGIGSASRAVIAVSPANADVVYFHTVSGSAYAGIYRSDDAGLNFVLKSTTPNVMGYDCNGGSGGQGWYDLDVAADPNNADVVYSAGVNIWKSINGGSTWTMCSHWYGGCSKPAVHADQHVLEFSPADGKLYAGNDGGVYVSDDNGTTWEELTSGLAISQIYKIGQAKTDVNKVMNGYQDNGSATSLEDGFLTVMGGDGMDCTYDHTDDTYAYGEYYNGQGISRIVNNQNQGGISGGISESGDWVTPIALDVTENETMYVGMQNVWKSSNIRSNNVSWQKITNIGGGNCNVLEQSEANNDIMYVSKYNGNFYRTDNLSSANPNWIDISDQLPTSGNATDVESNPFDENEVYITINSKVYKSSDKGLSWDEITYNIPNVSTNTIEYYKNDEEGLYVGTDAGIYYKNANMTEWVLFSQNFPVSANITEIEIFIDENNPSNDVVKAATYGRGLWSSPAYYGTPTANFESDETNVPSGCMVNFFDKSSGVPHSWNWTFEGGTPSYSTERNPTNIQYLEEGTFEVTLTVTNPAGQDVKTVSSYITANSAMLPLVDFMTADSVICSNQASTFVDMSEGCPVAWNWTFEPATVNFINGTDANSQNPQVSFDEAGMYNVSLEVTNSAGNAELTKNDYVKVGGQSLPYLDGFDGITLSSSGWEVDNPDGGKTWAVSEVGGASGPTNAAWMNFYNYTSMSARDYMNSPLLSFVGYENVLLSFDYAYAQRYNQKDSLIVNVSSDCGETWTRVYANGPDGEGIFETSEPTTSFFEPNVVEDWAGSGYGASKPIIDLNQWAGMGNIKIQFESFNQYGNNLYIDNVEVSNTLGLFDEDNNSDISIYPNPARDNLTVILRDNKNYKLSISNLQGQILMENEISSAQSRIDISKLPKGVYVISIENAENSATRKLIVQ